MTNLTEKLEYFCPYCKEWVYKSQFLNHKQFHFNDYIPTYPLTIEELEKRSRQIGMWDEK